MLVLSILVDYLTKNNMNNLTYNSFLNLAARFGEPEIRATEMCVEQFRFPRSRKRRIRNKWAKRPVNWRPARRGYLDKAANVLYVHPEVLTQMKKAVDKPPQSP